MKDLLRTTAFALMAALAVRTAWTSVQFVTFDTEVFDPLFRAKYAAHLPVILVHAVCGIAALALGPVAFLTFRGRWRVVHRYVGRTYMLAVALGAPTGLYMAAMAFGGPVAQVGLSVLAILWAWTGWWAYRSARGRRFAEHRLWMMRNYALTFAAVTLRLALNVGVYAGWDYTVLYRVAAWGCWVVPLAAVELWIRWRHPAAPPWRGSPPRARALPRPDRSADDGAADFPDPGVLRPADRTRSAAPAR